MQTVPDLLRRRAREDPGRWAIEICAAGEWRQMTFEGWWTRAEQIALGLVALGVQPGDRVAVCFTTKAWFDYAAAYAGVLAAGGIAVHVLMPTDQFTDELLAVTRPRFALCEEGGLALTGVQALTVDQVAAAAVAGAGLPDLDPYAAAHVLTTSGTGGRPAAIACSHANLTMAGQEPLLREIGLPEMPYAVGETCPPDAPDDLVHLLQGWYDRYVVVADFTVAALAEAFDGCYEGALYLRPRRAVELASTGAGADLTGVRALCVAGAALPPATARALRVLLPNARLVVWYGQVESSPAITIGEHDPTKTTAAGRPGFGTEVAIVDDGGRRVPPGTIGEILMRNGRAPRRCYYGDEERDAAKYASGWVHTEDLGFLDADGVLTVVDRRRETIARRDASIAPTTVETVLYEHPAVADVAVFGIPDEVEGERPVAAIVRRSAVSAQNIIEFASARLPEIAVPTAVVFVDEIPRGRTGKVARWELQALHGRAGASS